MTYKCIGEVLGTTTERARQVECAALRKIRRSKWGRKKCLELYNSEIAPRFQYTYSDVESRMCYENRSWYSAYKDSEKDIANLS